MNGRRAQVLIAAEALPTRTGLRLALEREFVAISHRPERLIGIPMAAHKAEAQILERMRRLAA